MRIEHALLICFLVLVAPAFAFESGTAKVCLPSADGQRFECIEKAAEAKESRQAFETRRGEANRSTSAAVVHEDKDAVTEIADPSDNEPIPNAKSLPAYLRHNASEPASEYSDEPASASPAPPELEMVAQPATVEPARDLAAPMSDPTQAEAIPDRIEPVAAREVTATPAPAAGAGIPATETPVVVEEVLVSDPVPSSPTAPEALQTEESPPEVSPPPITRPTLGSAGFRQLNASRYTLELAKGRDISSLQLLASALGDIPGTPYLLEFSLPDGIWYSLVWSDFASPEAARDARDALPAEIAITSGWPRKIGPLQKEISR